MLLIGLGEIIILAMVAIGGLLLARTAMLSKAARQPKPGVAFTAGAGEPDFDSIRQRVERRFHRRYEMVAHIVMYLVIIAGLWILRLPPPALILIAGAWGLAVLLHGLQFLFAEMSDRAIEREIERERSRFYEADKPKRSHLRLSDEGELLDVIEDEWEAGEKHKRG